MAQPASPVSTTKSASPKVKKSTSFKEGFARIVNILKPRSAETKSSADHNYVNVVKKPHGFEVIPEVIPEVGKSGRAASNVCSSPMETAAPGHFNFDQSSPRSHLSDGKSPGVDSFEQSGNDCDQRVAQQQQSGSVARQTSPNTTIERNCEVNRMCSKYWARVCCFSYYAQWRVELEPASL